MINTHESMNLLSNSARAQLDELGLAVWGKTVEILSLANKVSVNDILNDADIIEGFDVGEKSIRNRLNQLTDLGALKSLYGSGRRPTAYFFPDKNAQLNKPTSLILNDTQIAELARQGMIEPFSAKSINTYADGVTRCPSYGLSSYGYDLRLSPSQFQIFSARPRDLIDPMHFDDGMLIDSPLIASAKGSYFVLPGNSYGLGVAMERLKMPDNIVGICIGKSTYARCGIIVNVTPAEPGWEGYLTLELSNSSNCDAKIYAGAGICQIQFFAGEPCEVSYGDRNGKYQNQPMEIVHAR